MNRIFFLFLLFSTSAVAQVNLSLGLRAYYPFTGNANDISGNNNNPIFNNATPTTDISGYPNSAYHFNGTNTYMQIPNSATLNMGNSISVALWVKPMGFYTGTCHNNMLVAKGDADFLPGNYSLRYTPNPAGGCVASPPFAQSIFYGVNSTANTPFVQLNQWYSVIWTSDGTTSRIYVNCQLRNSGASGNLSFTNGADLFFGRLNNAGFPFWFNGDLDEIRIYDRVLNQDEVNFLGGCGPLPLTFTGIQANRMPGGNLISWKIAQETDCLNYQVQKSTDALNWQNTGNPIIARNVSGIQQYEYTDPTNNSPISYYRVKQTSINGSYLYSSVVFVKNKEEMNVSLHPKPADDFLFVSTGSLNLKLRSLEVYSVQGQRLIQINPGDVKQYSLDISNLSAAYYILKTQLSDGSFNNQLFIKK